jgi:hypothetical protein
VTVTLAPSPTDPSRIDHGRIDHSQIHHSWIYRRAVLPILALLRMGASPRTLAWSIAAGLLIGINPIIGTTTVLCLAIAFPFRLNVVAAQIANHAMSLSASAFLHAARTTPLALTRQLWLWEWHALLLWIAISAVAAPLIALALTPLLRRLLTRVQRHQYPILPSLTTEN